jgi:hypothetical protein
VLVSVKGIVDSVVVGAAWLAAVGDAIGEVVADNATGVVAGLAAGDAHPLSTIVITIATRHPRPVMRPLSRADGYHALR